MRCITIEKKGGEDMLTESKLSNGEVQTYRARILDLEPLQAKVVMLNLLAGMSLDDAIAHTEYLFQVKGEYKK
jgi:hypothetical protein